MDKRVIIIYGNCHTEALTDMLLTCDELLRDYEIVRIKPIHTIKSVDYFDDPIFLTCDVFIHQSIQKGNRYGVGFSSENVIMHLKPGCRIISIPNLYHLPKCFFPQYYEETELKRKGMTIFFRDRIVDGRNRHQGKKKVLEAYCDSNYFDHETIKVEFSKFIDKVKMREQDWDIKISGFIMDNYREHQLFYDPNHPTNFLIRYIAAEIVKMLVLIDKSAGDGRMFDMSRVRLLDSYEMPVCLAVKDALGIAGGVQRDISTIRFRKKSLQCNYGTSSVC